MDTLSQPSSNTPQPLDDCLYNRSPLMRWMFGPGCSEATEDTKERFGRFSYLARGFKTRIFLLCIAWVAVFLVVTGLEETWVKESYDPAGLVDLGFLEDWYTWSVIVALGLLLLTTRKTISVFYATFYGKDGLRKAIDRKRFSEDKYLELTRQGFEFVQHRRGRARMGFFLLVVLTVAYLAISLWSHMAEQSENDYWYKASYMFGNAVWMAFVVIVVLLIGVGIAWRVVAMIYQARRIVKTLDKLNVLVVPARVSEKEGIGLVFSLSYWMSLVPLTLVIPLIAWFAFSAGFLYDQALVAAVIIAATALIAFFSTAEALISAAKRQKTNEINEISTTIDSLFRQFKEISEHEDARSGSALDRITNRINVLVQVREVKMSESVWPTDSFVQLVGILLLQAALMASSPSVGGFSFWS